VSFGTKLEEYRRCYGMNKKTLAERVGITPSHLGEIENDKVNPPKARTIHRIGEVLRLSSEEVTDLLEEAKNTKLSSKGV